MRLFRDHDKVEYERLTDWIRQTKTRGANKEKPERHRLPAGCKDFSDYYRLHLAR